MRTRIKFCGLVRPVDLDTSVALGVDAVGFVFYRNSPRALSVQEAAALRRRLPSYVAAVGLFVNAPAEQVLSTVSHVGLDVVQFHGDETAQQCEQSTPQGLGYWRAVRMSGPGDLLESLASHKQAEALLLDSFSDGFGGSGKGFDWGWIPENRAKPLVLSGGLDADSVGAAIAAARPMAVDVSSGIQGHDAREKDPARMERFVAAVIQADARAKARGAAPEP
ncbi:MAG: phosphoribosylanthranilate isomerase [Quisquiliibacterium sp.]